jgi:hypothetical protein
LSAFRNSRGLHTKVWWAAGCLSQFHVVLTFDMALNLVDSATDDSLPVLNLCNAFCEVRNKLVTFIMLSAKLLT